MSDDARMQEPVRATTDAVTGAAAASPPSLLADAGGDDAIHALTHRHAARASGGRAALTAPGEPLVRVLLAEADATAAVAIAAVLRAARFDVVTARSGREALAIAGRAPFTLLLCDVHLPDMSGVDLVHRLRGAHVERPFIAIGARASVPDVVAAMRIGASTLLELPLDPAVLVAAVRTAIAPAAAADGIAAAHASGAATAAAPPRSTAERWARFVWCVTDAASDPKTLTEWARLASVSRSALAECCRLVRVSPRHARDFARVLRALTRSGDRWQPEAVLDFADARTRKKLLRAAGLAHVTHAPTIAEFLDRQEWIPLDNPGLSALRVLLAHAHR